MRENFHGELRLLDEQLGELGRLATEAIAEATEALAVADRERAESVLSSDARLDSLRDEIQERAATLLALQAPVASELRRIFAALLIATELERMGDLAEHIAGIARRRSPNHAATDSLTESFRQMGEHAHRLAQQMCRVLRDDDVELARSLEQEDDELDRLKRIVQDELLYSPEMPGATHSESVQHAVDGVLLARFFERYGDHAVSVARRVVFRCVGGAPGGDTSSDQPAS
ncbi:phosphate signaling complex protein PhoU [Parasphingorhabdus pacifica]